MRVLFVTNIPSPYQVDFFAELSGQSGLDIYVIFAAASESDRQFAVPAQLPFCARILRSDTWGALAKDAHYVKNFATHLDEFKTVDLVVIAGSYFMPVALQCRSWADRHSIPWMYWGEDPRKKVDSWWRGRLRETYLRVFLRSAVGAFGVGSRACRTYQVLLGEGRPVFNLPYAPDLRPITRPSEHVQQLAKKCRADWGVSHPEVMLFSGSLSERKAPDMLIAAMRSLAGRHPDLCLLVAGDGPLRDTLERTVCAAGLHSRVRFLGFVEGDELRAAYLAADLFVLPTRTHEGWGVVVQEALAAGLPVLVSDRVGSAHDLIDAQTGHQFVANDQVSLERELNALLADDERASAARRAGRISRAEASGSQAAARRTADVLRALARGDTSVGQVDQ